MWIKILRQQSCSQDHPWPSGKALAHQYRGPWFECPGCRYKKGWLIFPFYLGVGLCFLLANQDAKHFLPFFVTLLGMLFCFSCLTFNPKDISCAKYREKKNMYRITTNGRKRESRERKTTCFVDQQHHVTGVHQTMNSVLACTCDPLHDLAPLRSK